jgi:hypothetical protein
MQKDGKSWKKHRPPARRRVPVLHVQSGSFASIWNHGSLLFIFVGEGDQMPAFKKSAPELWSKAEAPPQRTAP